MEEYADYIDENGMITITWWTADESTTPPPPSPPIGTADYADTDAEHTLS
jgi:hypothetical protein